MTDQPTMTSAQMEERVARAIDPQAFDSKFCHEKGCPDCDDNRDAAMGRARAAIEAMDAAPPAGEGGMREALEMARDCLQSIADMKEDEPRQPDDADWRWRALECKRCATVTLAALSPSAEAPGDQAGVREALAIIKQLSWYYFVNDCDERDQDDALEIPIRDLRAAHHLAHRLELGDGPTVISSVAPSACREALIERLRSTAADMVDFDGKTMKEWDNIRAKCLTHRGSDLPRLMFEGLIEGFSELMLEAAAAHSAAQSSGEAVAWRWRQIDQPEEWIVQIRQPKFLNPTHFISEPLYAAPPAAPAVAGEIERLLRKISDLAYDEAVGEPLDDAIGCANKALALIAALRGARGDDVMVPAAALDWLFGAAPDADGKWFDDEVPHPKYSWRSKFRSMIPALSRPAVASPGESSDV